MRRGIALWWSSIALVIASTTGTLAAHPLGNFTINHLAKITPKHDAFIVRYVVDIAEIPTFQIMHETSADESWTAAKLRAWGDTEVALVSNGFHASIDGMPLKFHPIRHAERLRPGTGGLPILYWSGDFTALVGSGKHRVTIDDEVYAGRRIGWKDIVVAPQTEPTHELLSYPNASIGSPRHIDFVKFDLEGGRATAISSREDFPADINGSNSIVRTNALSDMFSSGNRAPLFVIFTILAAFGLGALHALEPGHGKALLAFTLVGARATTKQAAILAASLTFAHTIGVLLLGIVLFFAADFVSESIYPWITLLSGVAVAIVGARSLARNVRARQVHWHEGKVHSHTFRTDHHHGTGERGHSHEIPGTAPIDFRGAIVAATSGGIAPCPAAIVVMLAALRLHEIAYGLALIVVFSLGLASVLTALGIAVVHGASRIVETGRFAHVVSAGPLLSGALISAVGAVMIAEGLIGQGVAAPTWILAALAVLAIAGYAIAPQHAHDHSKERQAV